MSENFTRLSNIYKLLHRPETRTPILAWAFIENASAAALPTLTVFSELCVHSMCLLRLKSVENRLDRQTQEILEEIDEDLTLRAGLIRLENEIASRLNTGDLANTLPEYSYIADILDGYLGRWALFEDSDENHAA